MDIVVGGTGYRCPQCSPLPEPGLTSEPEPAGEWVEPYSGLDTIDTVDVGDLLDFLID